MGRVALVFLLLCAAAPALPEWTESEILRRWDRADAEERRRMGPVLDRLRRARRYAAARPIVVVVDKRAYTLAELFDDVLDKALATPLEPEGPNDLGLTDLHRRALAGLEELRKAFAAPAAVRTGTLNLMLDYAHATLLAGDLSLRGRLRFFGEALRNVHDLEGRAKPDATTRWLLHNRLLPALLGMARRTRRDKQFTELLSDAASLLFLPSILDARARELLAPLTRGKESRRILLRAYRQGALDRLGLVSMARSVAARTRDDPAFAAGAPPLVLELLTEPTLPLRERGALLDAALASLSDQKPFERTLVDLCAAAYGGAPLPLAQYRARRRDKKDVVARPEPGHVHRFLRVVLMQPSGEAPRVVRVVRVDTPLYRAIHVPHPGGGRQFVGVLAPSGDGPSADFLGPAPSEAGGRDNRLLRRALRLERIAITVFGARNDVIELCVALPDDDSEPVPPDGNAKHVLDLVAARLARSGEPAERADLVRLLGRIDTAEARALAARYARKAGAVAALLEIAERGDKPAATALLGKLSELDLERRERALNAAVKVGLNARVVALGKSPDVATAVLAGDALLNNGDVDGIRVLLKHPNRYARAAGTALALRLTPLAGSFRIASDRTREIAELCRSSFAAESDMAWKRYGAWLRNALLDPEQARKDRLEYRSIIIGHGRGRQELTPVQYYRYLMALLTKDEFKSSRPRIPPHFLSAFKPGRGVSAKNRAEILAAIEQGLQDKAVRAAWKDALIVLACVQHGIELQPELGKLAHERLTKLAGGKAPPGTRRKPGIYWPIWAAAEARG